MVPAVYKWFSVLWMDAMYDSMAFVCLPVLVITSITALSQDRARRQCSVQNGRWQRQNDMDEGLTASPRMRWCLRPSAEAIRRVQCQIIFSVDYLVTFAPGGPYAGRSWVCCIGDVRFVSWSSFVNTSAAENRFRRLRSKFSAATISGLSVIRLSTATTAKLWCSWSIRMCRSEATMLRQIENLWS